MSIAGIGSQGSGNLSQILSSLLTRLDTTSSSTDTTASQSDTTTTTTAAADGNLTGSTKPSLSSMILGVLMGLQNQSSTTSTTTATASQDGTDPVSKLFSAMDSDSDGSVSKSELESYIQNAGGTASEADNLYSQLTTSDSGISQSDLASAAPPPPPPGGHGGHGGGPGGPPPCDSTSGTNSIGSQMVSELDSDNDGSISQSELTDYLTANGGTETEAQSLFSSLSTDGSTSISATDIDNAIQKMASSYASNPYASILNMLDNYNTGTQSSSAGVSVSA